MVRTLFFSSNDLSSSTCVLYCVLRGSRNDPRVQANQGQALSKLAQFESNHFQKHLHTFIVLMLRSSLVSCPEIS